MGTRFPRRGMSLIEVMAAMAVILTMALLVWQSLHNAVEFHELLSKRDVHSRAARVTLGKLRRDLQLAYLTTNRAAVETYETVFVGMDDNPDKLYFASLSHQRIYANSRECDQTEITVWTDSAPRDRGRGYVLFHREAPRIDDEPAEDGRIYPLAYNVRSLNFRYLDGIKNEWVDEWDSRSAETPGRLPRAVEIGLVLIGEDPDDEDRTVDLPFLTTVVLEYAAPLKRNAQSGEGGVDDIPPDLRAQIQQRLNQGMSPDAIADELGVDVATVGTVAATGGLSGEGGRNPSPGGLGGRSGLGGGAAGDSRGVPLRDAARRAGRGK